MSSHWSLGLPSVLFPSCFPSKTLYEFLLPPCVIAPHSHPHWCGNPNIIWWGLQAMKLFTGQFRPVPPSPKPEDLPCCAVGTHCTRTVFNVDITLQTNSMLVWPVTKWIWHAILTNGTSSNHLQQPLNLKHTNQACHLTHHYQHALIRRTA